METGGRNSVEVENLAPLTCDGNMICRLFLVQKIKEQFPRIGLKLLTRMACVSVILIRMFHLINAHNFDNSLAVQLISGEQRACVRRRAISFLFENVGERRWLRLGMSPIVYILSMNSSAPIGNTEREWWKATRNMHPRQTKWHMSHECSVLTSRCYISRYITEQLLCAASSSLQTMSRLSLTYWFWYWHLFSRSMIRWPLVWAF